MEPAILMACAARKCRWAGGLSPWPRSMTRSPRRGPTRRKCHPRGRSNGWPISRAPCWIRRSTKRWFASSRAGRHWCSSTKTRGPLSRGCVRSFLPLWLLVLAAPIGVGAQDTIPFLVRVEDRGRVTVRDRIVIRDPRTGADREIFRTPHAEGHIPYQVTVSPDGRYLAFIEVVCQTGAGEIRLTVIDRSGRIVRLLGESSIHAARGIREHLWCCGPHILAILVGTLSPFERPSGESSSLPPGLSLIDLRTGSTVAHVDGLRFP